MALKDPVDEVIVDTDDTGDEAEDKDADRGDDAGSDDELEESGSGDKDEEKSEDKSDDKDEDKSEDKPDEKKKQAMVPQKRMKEAVEKERKAREATEAKLKAAEDKIEEGNRGVDLKKLTEEIEGLEDDLDKAIADNKPEDKKRIRALLRDKMQTMARAEAAAMSAQATALAVERVRYDALVERLEKDYPVMNPDSDDYDEAVVAEIVEMKEAFEAKGISSSDALKKAAKYVIKPVEKKQDDETDDDAEGEDAAAKKAEVKRREAAAQKGLDAKKRQPSSADKGGKPSDKNGGGIREKMDKLTDDEFDKLDPKEVARARGDDA